MAGFRNVPLLLQLFLWFFVVPEILPAGLGPLAQTRSARSRSCGPSIVALGLFTSARVAVQVRVRNFARCRAGSTWPRLASGMNTGADLPASSCCRKPLRIVLPPLTSDFLTDVQELRPGVDHRRL